MPPAHATSPLLGKLSPADFLARYWQRRPLLLRGALRGFRDPLDADELAGLACEPEVESRLVLARGGRKPWEVVHGPQDARRLRRLPRTHWTLLVQEADRHVPALAELLERFDFVPRWRLDDVMVSFAPRHGSVGPHVDSYDVFLLQGRGRRLWRIDPQAPPDLRPGFDLRLLRSFQARREFVLEPGDMLYLPPGLAHHGISLEDAFTYSIGFRAPSYREILGAFGRHLVSLAREDLHYRDRLPAPPVEPGEIGADAFTQLGLILEAQLLGARLPDQAARFVGELLTQPKGLLSAPRARRIQAAEVLARLQAGAPLLRRPSSHAAYVRRGPSRNDLFVDGRAFELRGSLAAVAPLLTRTRRVEPRELRRRLRTRGLAELLAELINLGAYELGARPRGPRGSRPAAGSRS